jgi:hypothetical protein
MRAKLTAVVLAALVSAAATAQAPAPAASTPITYDLARNAHYLFTADGHRLDIFEVTKGPNGSVGRVSLNVDGNAREVPAETLSAGEKRGLLKTSLTYNQLAH